MRMLQHMSWDILFNIHIHRKYHVTSNAISIFHRIVHATVHMNIVAKNASGNERTQQTIGNNSTWRAIGHNSTLRGKDNIQTPIGNTQHKIGKNSTRRAIDTATAKLY